MSSIIVITYQTHPDKVEAGHKALADLIQVVKREEKDCIAIQMHQDTSDPTKILLWEEWTTEESFKGPHMTTPHITAFMTKARELYVGPPALSFWKATVKV